MKRISLLIIGYYLIFQAFITALNIFGTPEYTVYLLPLAALSGWGGYKLIRIAKPQLPPVPETQPLPEAHMLPVDRETRRIDKP